MAVFQVFDHLDSPSFDLDLDLIARKDRVAMRRSPALSLPFLVGNCFAYHQASLVSTVDRRLGAPLASVR